MLLVMPNILGMFNEAKIKTFKVQVQSLISASEKQKIADALEGLETEAYCNGLAVCNDGIFSKKLSISLSSI